MQKALPPNNQVVMPYLIVKDAPSFIAFLKDVFGGKELRKHLRDDSNIMHAEVIIGDSTIMIADSSNDYPLRPGGLFIYVDDADAVAGLCDGGAIEAQMSSFAQTFNRKNIIELCSFAPLLQNPG